MEALIVQTRVVQIRGPGVVVDVVGSVLLRRHGGLSVVSVGRHVEPGDGIRLAEHASARISFGNGRVLSLDYEASISEVSFWGASIWDQDLRLEGEEVDLEDDDQDLQFLWRLKGDGPVARRILSSVLARSSAAYPISEIVGRMEQQMVPDLESGFADCGVLPLFRLRSGLLVCASIRWDLETFERACILAGRVVCPVLVSPDEYNRIQGMQHGAEDI